MERLSLDIEEKALDMIELDEDRDLIAKAMGFKSLRQFNAYIRKFPEFAEQVQDAEIEYSRTLEKQLMSIPHIYAADVARVLSSNIIKRLEAIDPRRYSQKVQHEISAGPNMMKAIEDARARSVEPVSIGNVAFLNHGIRKEENE